MDASDPKIVVFKRGVESRGQQCQGEEAHATDGQFFRVHIAAQKQGDQQHNRHRRHGEGEDQGRPQHAGAGKGPPQSQGQEQGDRQGGAHGTSQKQQGVFQRQEKGVIPEQRGVVGKPGEAAAEGIGKEGAKQNGQEREHREAKHPQKACG